MADRSGVAPSYRWLLLVHLLPATPSNLRVRIWRRLQQIGAMAVKQSVYVLPDSPDAREDFEWLRAEIAGAGGEATVFKADTLDSWATEALIDEFRGQREDAYKELHREAKRLLKAAGARSRLRAAWLGPRVTRLREQVAAVERIDFFGSASRDKVLMALQQLEERATPPDVRGKSAPGATSSNAEYRNRVWVTRPRPGVDRMASAWLIKRFVDPQARFDFVADHASAPADSVTFDMFGGEFTHRGDLCTYEVLCQTFALDAAAITQIGAVVHDLDLKDGRHGAVAAPTVGSLIEGLQIAHADDQALLSAGMAMFEALYQSQANAMRPRVSTPRKRPRARQ